MSAGGGHDVRQILDIGGPQQKDGKSKRNKDKPKRPGKDIIDLIIFRKG